MVGDALHVRTYGPEHGLPVLALHGIKGHPARRRVLAEALPELRFVAVDLRGHGHSPWTPPWGPAIELSPRDMLECTAEVACLMRPFPVGQ